MSATSGIGISPELSQAFSSAVDYKQIRFLKVSIQNELLVPDLSENAVGSLEDDLVKLQGILEDNVPAYVLVRLDDPSTEWLAIHYVPESAKVREKMLYASTRNSLTKALGSGNFTDAIFATSKADLTPEAYKAHKAHMAAPQPLSKYEKEMADIKAAERAAGPTGYEGSRGRQSHVGTGVGLEWTSEVEHAVSRLGEGEEPQLVVVSIDGTPEYLVLTSTSEISIGQLGSALPTSEPCYAFFAYSHATPPRREIVFIYSCPSSSPIKYRMLYSSGSSSVFQRAKVILSSSPSTLSSRKVETSDPKELTEAYLRSELALTETAAAATSVDNGEKKGFARPKGPGRKR